MHAGIGCTVSLNKLSLPANLSMALVAIMFLAMLLCPAGVYILVALLVRIIPSGRITSPILDSSILTTAVALSGSLHNCSIYILTLIETESLGIQYFEKIIEQGVKNTFLGQLILACPDHLLVVNFPNCTNAKEITEAGAVDDLILYLMVVQTIITLQKYDLGHKNHVNEFTSRRRFTFLT